MYSETEQLGIRKTFILYGLLLVGCNVLPPGDPPGGAIVHNPTNEIKNNTIQAKQHLLTSFIAYTLTDLPGVEIQCDGNFLSEYLVCEAGKVSGIRMVKKSEYTLKTYQSDATIWAELQYKRQILWRKDVAIGVHK